MTRERAIQAALLGAVGLVIAAVGLRLARFEAAPRPGPRATPLRSARPSPGAPASAPLSSGVGVMLVRLLGSFRQFEVTAPITSESGQEIVLAGGVRIQAEGEDRHTYTVQSESLRGDRDWKHFVLAGGVRIRRSDGLMAEAETAEHFQAEQSEVLAGNVRIEHDGQLLLCQRLEFKRASDELFLDGPVTVFEPARPGAPAQLLRSAYLYHSRAKAQILARDEVRVIRDGLRIEADQLEVKLEDRRPRMVWFCPAGGRLTRVEVWEAGACASEDGEAPLREIVSNGIEITCDEQGRPVQVRPANWVDPVRVEGRSPEVLLWSLDLGRFHAWLKPAGGLQRLEVTQGLRWREEAGPQRAAQVLRAPEARMTGEEQAIEFPSGLTLEDERIGRLTGRRARRLGGILEVTQEPSLEGREGTLRAERLRLGKDAGALEAEGQVRTEWRPGPGAAALGERGEPVRFRAEALRRLPDGRLEYRGGARASQGSSVLEADLILVDKDMRGLDAQGHVRWLRAGPGEEGVSGSCDRLSWSEERIELTGAVALESGDLSLTAERAVIQLAGRRVQSLRASGDVQVARLGARAWAETLEHDAERGSTRLRAGARMVRVLGQDGSESWADEMSLVRQGERIVIGSGQDGLSRTRLGDLESRTR